MKDKEIDKIAQAIAAKLGEPGGPGVLGCGDASSSENYSCDYDYSCDDYECGGAGFFRCINLFECNTEFECYSDFNCYAGFHCAYHYN